MEREVITRGNLPHWYMPHAAHFVTYRLAGTIPVSVFQELRAREVELLQQPLPAGVTAGQRRYDVHKILFGDYDRYLDAQRSIDWLARPAIAAMVRSNLYHHNGKKYRLLAYCIMPNHVHVLFIPLVGEAASFASGKGEAGSFAYEKPWGERPDRSGPLAEIMHSLKSYTANRANEILGRAGQFWQHESYDHWIRDEAELERVVEYIDANPVRALLVQSAHEWEYGSAHDRFLRDGLRTGFLGDLP